MASRGFIELLRLADLAAARKSRRHSKSRDQWIGVAFEVAGQRFVAPMGEISEVLAMPTVYSSIPLSQPWLVGVANVRGRLLPLTDLSGFIGITAPTLRLTERKVLVIDQADIFSGLVVDKVLGIQQFDFHDYVAEPLADDSPFMPYNHGKFVKNNEDWYVFMPSLLTQDGRYLEAAV